MNLLFRVLFAHGCRSTHHKLAMDALCHLRGDHASKWQNLFLKHHALFLDGAKAPDTKFKDFRNHVLHVRDNYWGGAVKTSRLWYQQAVEDLRQQDWRSAVYSLGVLSHYYTDPIMPYHTGQSVSESNLHRATEWSITKSYDILKSIVTTRTGYPHLEAPAHADWLDDMVKGGAELSNQYYEKLIEHYDIDKGVKDPPAGLDATSQEFLAELIAHATIGFSRILERAIAEAGVQPPIVSVTLQGFLAVLQIPVRWVTKKLADAQERKVVEAMYQELQATGRVEETLPEDDRVVRELHAKEVLAHRTEPTPTSTQVEPSDPEPAILPFQPPTPSTVRQRVEENEDAKPLRFYLETSDAIEQAPSIGAKTAARLNRAEVHTITDLLEANPTVLAETLDARHISAQTIVDWQAQARLVCTIPQIRGHDAQFLVACDYREASAVADAVAEELLQAVTEFVGTKEGERILRGGKEPDLAEVRDWIAWAGQARALKVA